MRTLSERIEIFQKSDLYPVISSEFCNGRNVCDILSGIAAAGAKIVQIREKNISDSAMFELVTKCKNITDRYGMLLIVDDRLDIAMAAQADGVHLGQDDIPLSEAKKVAPELFFGVSTHNAEEIGKALADAHQLCAAYLPIVQHCQKPLHAGLAQKIANLGKNIFLKHPLNERSHEHGSAFHGFQENIAGEAVADDHIHAAH